jgi:hypothetical protein
MQDHTGKTYDRPMYLTVAGRGFLAIENVREVEKLVRQTLLDSRSW